MANCSKAIKQYGHWSVSHHTRSDGKPWEQNNLLNALKGNEIETGEYGLRFTIWLSCQAKWLVGALNSDLNWSPLQYTLRCLWLSDLRGNWIVVQKLNIEKLLITAVSFQENAQIEKIKIMSVLKEMAMVSLTGGNRPSNGIATRWVKCSISMPLCYGCNVWTVEKTSLKIISIFWYKL